EPPGGLHPQAASCRCVRTPPIVRRPRPAPWPAIRRPLAAVGATSAAARCMALPEHDRGDPGKDKRPRKERRAEASPNGDAAEEDRPQPDAPGAMASALRIHDGRDRKST